MFSNKTMRKICDSKNKTFNSGQMTVEFVVVFPVLIVIALIGTNALLFMSECASFDRIFRETVCLYGASPGSNVDTGQTVGKVQAQLDNSFSHDFESVSVSSYGTAGGLVRFEGKIEFKPTLFGAGLLDSAFGVSFPKMSHSNQITIDVYKPGIFV